MATLLGRTGFFSTTPPTSGGVDYREFTKTAAISKRWTSVLAGADGLGAADEAAG